MTGAHRYPFMRHSYLIENKIERFHPLDEYIDQEREEHSFEKQRKEFESKKEESLNRIRTYCSIFKATRPIEWKAFEEEMNYLFSHVKMLNKRDPFSFLGMHKDGVPIDAQYWTLTKAYTDGQMAILDSMFELINISIEQIKNIDELRLNPPVKKSFLKKCLQFFVK